MSCADYQLSACRDQVFDRLNDIWTETASAEENDPKSPWSIDIWRKANTLQAVAQYWHTVSDDTQKQKAMALMKKGYEFYLTRKADQSLWVDDFGWWAGFFTDLLRYSGNIAPDPDFTRAKLLAETADCYTRMSANLDAAHGGIWNNPDEDSPAREKNTVTNSWMLFVASQLSMLDTGRQAYYQMAAAAEYAWLTTGTYRGQPPAYWRLHTQEGLLLWLVNGPFTTSPSHGPFRDVCWTGDEGVFLNALTAYINGVADQSLKPTLVKDGRTLIDAAMTFFVANDVMHESPRNPDWSNDLATGKGVFMRLVTRFVLQHGFFGDAAFETQFKAFVSATAEAAWCTRLIPKVGDKTKWVIAPSWTPDSPPQEKSQDTTDDLWPQVLQTNGLDALNAAVLIG